MTNDPKLSQEMEGTGDLEEMADNEESEEINRIAMNESGILQEMNEMEEIEKTVQEENRNHSAVTESDPAEEENSGKMLTFFRKRFRHTFVKIILFFFLLR